MASLAGYALGVALQNYHFNSSSSQTYTFASATPAPTPTVAPTPIEVGCQMTITFNGQTYTPGSTIYLTSGTIVFTATLDHSKSGVTVNFMDGTGIVGSGTTDSNGVASYTYTGEFALISHTYSAVPTPTTQSLP